jgi:hypothetical protein
MYCSFLSSVFFSTWDHSTFRNFLRSVIFFGFASFSALLSPLPNPKHPLFPHPTHACEHLTDNDDINMLDSSAIWHSA